MATLQVTNLQNTAATVTNVSLLADGTTALVLNATGTSRTGGIRYNAGTLELYDGAAWVAAGGGSGTVTSVTASLPLASTGGATPNLTIGIGLGTAINGSNIAVSIPVAATPPAVGTSAVQATNGSLYWDNNLGALFLRYFDGTTAQWVQAAASGNVTAATAAQAAAGTLTTTYLSPATGVPKDAAGMTGAAILPASTTANRPGTPAAGWLRFNTSSDAVSPLPECEVYDGANWRGLEYRPNLGTPLPVLALTNGQTMPVAGNYETITVPAGATVTAVAGTYLTARSGITISGTINVSASIPGGSRSAGVSSGSVASFNGSNGQGPGTQGLAYGFGSNSLGSGAVSALIRVDNVNGSTGSLPGNGGGGLVLISQSTLTVNATAVINANGGAGSGGIVAPGGNGHTIPGSGGGSGGLIYLQAGSTLTVAAGATLSANGGNGAVGYCDGNQTAGGAGGGGGGGGGYIVLNAPTINNSGTLTVTGGSRGADAASAAPASVAYLGTSGAGFGGNGGNSNAGAWPNSAANGSAGQTLTNVYVF